jgi:hypothetical protein
MRVKVHAPVAVVYVQQSASIVDVVAQTGCLWNERQAQQAKLKHISCGFLYERNSRWLVITLWQPTVPSKLDQWKQ